MEGMFQLHNFIKIFVVSLEICPFYYNSYLEFVQLKLLGCYLSVLNIEQWHFAEDIDPVTLR